jgi:hypothetical protein
MTGINALEVGAIRYIMVISRLTMRPALVRPMVNPNRPLTPQKPSIVAAGLGGPSNFRTRIFRDFLYGKLRPIPAAIWWGYLRQTAVFGTDDGAAPFRTTR